jgi:hypothetical protein
MELIAYLSVLLILTFGLFLILISYKILHIKFKDSIKQERLNQWYIRNTKKTKIIGFIMIIWAILNFLFPNLNPYYGAEKKQEQPAKSMIEWTSELKLSMKKDILSGSKKLQSMNTDTASIVLDCFVEKYTQQYSVQDYSNIYKLSSIELQKIVNPIMSRCYAESGVTK